MCVVKFWKSFLCLYTSKLTRTLSRFSGNYTGASDKKYIKIIDIFSNSIQLVIGKGFKSILSYLDIFSDNINK